MSKRQSRYLAYERALREAYEAADRAKADMVEDKQALNCGFAWVTVHDRAFMAWCRRQAEESGERYGRHGSKSLTGGWQFWCPGKSTAQAVDIHQAGAKAFSESLAHALQIRCEWSSRLD
jgi:hypothetical protein